MPYYCHECERSARASTVGEEPTCDACGSSFIEEIEEEEKAEDTAPSFNFSVSFSSNSPILHSVAQFVTSLATSNASRRNLIPRLHEFISGLTRSNPRAGFHEHVMFNLADFGIGRDFGDILEQLRETYPEQYGPPPASNSAIASLKRRRVEEPSGSCAVCQEEYITQDTVAELSCAHIFHQVCIETWLKQVC